MLSFILCIALLFGLFSAVPLTAAYAATASQSNIVARANYLYDLTWTCQETVSGWRGNYTFSKGSTYRLPYGQPIDAGSYIGYEVSIEDFLAAAKTQGSIFYTSRSTYTGNSSSSVYYATDCSAFVSWCWGIDRKTAYSLPQVSANIGAVTAQNITKLELGDALNSSEASHVVLVTGLAYSGSTLTKIEITEQTPPQLKRSSYTPAELASKYSSGYTILRYSGTVPTAPAGSGSSDGKYYPACNASFTSIVSALDSIGVDSSKAYRTKIAEANGIADYSGTAEQNIAMLSLLKAGQLIDPEYKEIPTPSVSVSTTVYYPACDPTCETLISGLNSLGVDSSKAYRGKIAVANGISDYTGTAEQNNTLISLLQEGKLIDPNPTANLSIYKYLPPCGSACETIIDALNVIGVDSSQEYRSTIARVNGIIGYTATYEQDVTMLDMLKAGRLRNPEYSKLYAPSNFYPACSSYCTTIAGGLSDICADNSPAWISTVAQENGIINYIGTAEQNTALLEMLQSGTLVNPDPSITPLRSKYYPACSSSITTLKLALEAIGVESSKAYRTDIAAANMIPNYTGTAEQNNALLKLLKAGKLVHARYPGVLDSGIVTSGSNGYERGYDGGIPGSGWIVSHGLDVSNWDGNDLDFNRIKAAGYDYVILRAGTTNGKDGCFETNYTKARAAGLDIGAYYYTYATTVADAVADAQVYLSYIAGKKFEYPIYMDYEHETQEALNSNLSEDICLAFMAQLKAAGYLTGLYTGKYFATNLPMETICADYELWIAQYPKTGTDCTNDWTINGYTYADQYGMYQYASRVFIDGTYGPYDGNVCYKDYPAIVDKYGFNGYASSCAHSYRALIITPGCTTFGYTTHTCTLCGHSYTASQVPATGHRYMGGSCTVCGLVGSAPMADYYLFGWINGSDYACEEDFESMGDYKFVNGKLQVTFTEPSYVAVKAANNAAWYMTDGWQGDYVTSVTLYNTAILADRADKLYVPSGVPVTFTLIVNENDTMTLSYSTCNHSYKKAVTTAPTCTAVGITTYTCSTCGDAYTETIAALGHSYRSTVTAPTCTTVGYTKHTCNTCGDSYTTNQVAATGHSYRSSVIAPTCTSDGYTLYTCTVCGATSTTNTVPALSHSYTSSVTAPTCTSAGYTTYTCTGCGNRYTDNYTSATGHSFVNNKCRICGVTDTVTAIDYYLVGYINGVDYGCEADNQNMGQYKFVNGKLTATFTQDSYVFLKTTANANWYMTQSYCADQTATFYNTNTGANEKMFVPGNVEVRFTLTKNNNGTLTLSYKYDAPVVPPADASVVPTLTLKAPTLEFKDMICMVAFYTAENIQDVEEMGIITYSSKVSSWNVESADHVIPGATYDEGTGRYYSSSQGIHAKYLADTVYLAIYAKLKDGTYAYSKLAPYSAITYANSQLKNSTDVGLKQLVVAMLNYGAEAQLYFGHNVSSLANGALSAEQKALPEAYRSDMVKAVTSPSNMKQGNFASNSGFSSRKPAISFEGAFCINYFFTPKYVPDNGITLYYWDATAYNRAGVLTTGNATGKFKLNGSGIGEYSGKIDGIAAKQLSNAVYVAAVYQSGGTVWTSGVLGYSIGAYCSSQASKAGAVAELAKATAVYGYHAKQYFG